MGENDRIFKSKVLLIITEMVKIEDNGQFIYQVVNRYYENTRGRTLEFSLREEKEQGRARKVEIVNQEPSKIEFGVVYVLLGGKKVWIYNLLGDEEK